LVRFGLIASLCLAGAALMGCGVDRSIEPAAMLPRTGAAYRALDANHRAAVAAGCRDRVAAEHVGEAARQLRAADPRALRQELDDAFTVIAIQRRSVIRVCADVIPFVTPGLDVRFDDTKDGGDGLVTYETTSDKLLSIRGHVSPVRTGGRVVVRRELAPSAARSAAIQANGRFVIPRLHLRRIADNTFTVTITAPPNAVRKVHFSAICLDCLAGGAPPSGQQ
jgi:hypothetical protein